MMGMYSDGDVSSGEGEEGRREEGGLRVMTPSYQSLVLTVMNWVVVVVVRERLPS
jgi:hypothetical protein